MWPVKHAGRKSLVTGPSGSGLEIGSGRHLDPSRLEGGTVAGRGGLDDRRLGVRAGPQPVVDVDSQHLAAGPGGQDQQGKGVGPARHGQRQPAIPDGFVRPGKVAAGKQRLERVAAGQVGDGRGLTPPGRQGRARRAVKAVPAGPSRPCPPSRQGRACRAHQGRARRAIKAVPAGPSTECDRRRAGALAGPGDPVCRLANLGPARQPLRALPNLV